MLEPLKPGPLPSWYKEALQFYRHHHRGVASGTVRAPEVLVLPPYRPEVPRLALVPGSVFGINAVRNGGTAALREALELLPHVTQFPGCDAANELADVMFERVAAHLRNAGVVHRID